MDDPIFINKCDNKLSFETVEEAEGAAATAKWRYEQDKGAKLIPYLCHKCGEFHLMTEYNEDEV